MASRLEIPDTARETMSNNNNTNNDNVTRNARARHNVKFFVQSPEEDTHVIDDSDDITNIHPVPSIIDEWKRKKDAAARLAHNKANRHADKVRKHNSGPNSRRNSTEDLTEIVPGYTHTPPLGHNSSHRNGSDNFHQYRLERDLTEKPTVETDDSDEDDLQQEKERTLDSPAQNVVLPRSDHLISSFDAAGRLESGQSGLRSGWATPLETQNAQDYVPRPDQFKPSYLRQLLSAHNITTQLGVPQVEGRREVFPNEQEKILFSKLDAYRNPETDPRRNQPDFFQDRRRMPASPGSHSGTLTPSDALMAGSSGRLTPNKRPKWYKDDSDKWHYHPNDEDRKPSQMRSVAKLLESSLSASTAAATPTTAKTRPSASRRSSANSVLDLVKHPVNSVFKMSSSHTLRKEAEKRREEMLRMANDRVVCQEYIVRVARALMAYGAPTHRLEESLQMASRKLAVHANFQYLPGTMIMSFDDREMHISEVRLVKEPTKVDLGKLLDVQEIYKNVIHSHTSAAEAIDEIDSLEKMKPIYNSYWVVFTYGLAAVSVSPWAFSAQPIDFGIAFMLGCTLGSTQVFWAPRSQSFSYISEAFGTFITSLLARAFGSIRSTSGEPLFCFSALAQSSIALILPGWIILSAALELQSRNITAGSIRLVYALFYTLLLTFGTVFGTLLFGFMDENATNDLQCHKPAWWTLTSKTDPRFLYMNVPFVVAFTLCLAIVNQAKPKQLPWMLGISLAGYLANYFAGMKFTYSPIANAISAFVIGLTAHGYSRFFHGVAAAAMLPAIFVLVPSGLAASGGLTAGLTVANDQKYNTTSNASASAYSGVIFDVASSMLQVAVGISSGLFLSALCMYPFGKKRSGIFSF